jgi:hypothetical protein
MKRKRSALRLGSAKPARRCKLLGKVSMFGVIRIKDATAQERSKRVKGEQREQPARWLPIALDVISLNGSLINLNLAGRACRTAWVNVCTSKDWRGVCHGHAACNPTVGVG